MSPEQGPPDEIEIDSELWHKLDADAKQYLFEQSQIKYEDARRFDECEYKLVYN